MAGMVTRPRELAGEGGLMSFSGTFVKAAIEARKPIWIADAQSDARFASAASVMALDLRTILCVPLLVEGQLIGLLYVDRQSVNRSFGEDDLRLVEGLAAFAALAIANARRYEETRQHAAELGAATALVRLAAGRRPLSSVLDGILAEVMRALPSARGVLLLGEEPWPALALDAHGAPAEAAAPEELVARVAGTRAAIMEADALLAPLVVEDELLGALYLTRQQPYLPRDLALLETLAAQAAVVLDVAATREGLQRRVERLEDMAAELQSRALANDP
jgi:GAF domain-containing protein